MEAIHQVMQKTKQKRDVVIEVRDVCAVYFEMLPAIYGALQIARMVASEEAHASAALNRMIEEVLLMT